MRLLDLFNRFRRNKEEDIVEPVETINEPQGEYRFGTEHIYDYKLRAELKSIAKLENKTMGEIVGELVKDYVENYHKIEQKPTDPNSIAKCCWCGKEFTKKHHSEKYCSDECRREVKNERQRKSDIKRDNFPPVEISHGIKLLSSFCKDYKKVTLKGKQVKSTGGMKIPLNIDQLLYVANHMEDIPKETNRERVEWSKKVFGKKIYIIDKIIWNIYRGKFEEVFNEYFLKTHTIQFDKNGSLLTGGK